MFFFFFSQFQSKVHYGAGVMEAEDGDSWSHDIHTKEAERDGPLWGGNHGGSN